MKYSFRFIKITIIAITVSSISACSSIEKIRSDSLFEQYCNEDGRVGQFIYERVALGEDFFRPIPTDEVELRRLDKGFYIDGKKLLIDKERFEQSYVVEYWNKKMLSPTGPIYAFESTVIRKSDGKALSRAVSLLNMQGKIRKYLPVYGVTCPTGRDQKGIPLYTGTHDLIKKTFYKQ